MTVTGAVDGAAQVRTATGRLMEAEFADCYGAHFRALTTQIYAYLGDLGEAQDVVQEAFSRAWSRWDRLARYDDPVGWVRRVAWNLATSRIRRMVTARRYLRTQRPAVIAGPTPDRVALTTALGALPPRQRRAVVLYYLAGLTVVEIAQACRVREGTVRMWLHRGRAALAALLAEGAR